jgi:multiple sugar transport system substrate-binding protein
MTAPDPHAAEPAEPAVAAGNGGSAEERGSAEDGGPADDGGGRGPSRRAVLTVGGLGAVVAAGVAGGPPAYRALVGPRADTAPPENSITWAASPIDLNPSDYRQILIDAYLDAEPAARVRLLPGPTSTDVNRVAVVSAIDSGSDTPDVFLGDVIWPAEFGAHGRAARLDRIFPKSFWRRFGTTMLQPSAFRGHLYSAPLYANQGVLFYRRDLLSQAGLAVPETWEDLAAAARVLLARGSVTQGFIYQGAAYEGLTCGWTEFLADAGGRILDPTGKTPQLDSPAALRALSFLRELVDDGVTPPDITTIQEQQATQRFNAGEVAFMRGWNTADTLIAAKPATVGVTQLPTFAGRPGGGFSTVGGWGMFLNPHSSRTGPAMSFIDWMTSVPAQRILARFAQIPANERVRTDRTLMRGNQVLEITRTVRPVVRPSNIPNYADISRVVYTNVNEVLTRRATPADALRAAQSGLAEILRNS